MITIRQGTFKADIELASLETLSIVKIRKLIKLAFSSAEVNLSALCQMEEFLNSEAKSRKEALELANKAVFRCSQQDKKSYVLNQKKAKASYDRIMHIKSIFEKESFGPTARSRRQ